MAKNTRRDSNGLTEFLCSTHGPTWQKHCPNWQKKKKKKKKIDPDVAMLPTSKWFAVAPENHFINRISFTRKSSRCRHHSSLSTTPKDHKTFPKLLSKY